MPKPRRRLLTATVATLGLVVTCGASGTTARPLAGKAVTTIPTQSCGWLAISSLSGGDRRALTQPPAGGEQRCDYWPTWSPDGSRVAFARWTPNQLSLMVVDADGRGLRQVVGLGPRPKQEIGSITAIRWSPDGTSLAYATWGDSFGTDQIYVTGVDGAGQRLIAGPPKKASGYLSLFGWTIDGRRVIYSYTVGEPLGLKYTGPSYLRTASADGAGTVKVVTEDAVIDASWTANGSILYVRHCISRPCQLALRNPATGVSRPLTHFRQWCCHEGEWDSLAFMRRPKSRDIVYTHGRSIYEFSPTTNRTRTVRALRCPRRRCRPLEDEVYLAGITTNGRFALIEFYDENSLSLSKLTREYRLDLRTRALTRIHLATADPAEIYLP